MVYFKARTKRGLSLPFAVRRPLGESSDYAELLRGEDVVVGLIDSPTRHNQGGSMRIGAECFSCPPGNSAPERLERTSPWGSPAESPTIVQGTASPAAVRPWFSCARFASRRTVVSVLPVCVSPCAGCRGLSRRDNHCDSCRQLTDWLINLPPIMRTSVRPVARAWARRICPIHEGLR
jgi:hypothetical protein